jgi:hypothetical protein
MVGGAKYKNAIADVAAAHDLSAAQTKKIYGKGGKEAIMIHRHKGLI